jgi:hypothetical protein
MVLQASGLETASFAAMLLDEDLAVDWIQRTLRFVA